MIRLDQLGQIPTWIAIAVVAVLTVCLFIGIPLARRAGRKAAILTRTDAKADTGHGKDRIALFAALAPSVLVWLAVMGVSFIGLTGFAADFMQWRHWTNMLVPLSLDGISVSFGGWAFVAVRRGRHPGRAYRIVLAAACLSATLNFVHGRQAWSIWAGIYLSFLSMAGMSMFHEMLDQFMATHNDEITHNAAYPRFGQRWVWAPISTLKARRAWIVYPPPEGTRPTISNALAHWRAVRRMTRAQRLDGDAPWPVNGDNATPIFTQTGTFSREPTASLPAPSHTPGQPVNGEPVNGSRHDDGAHADNPRHALPPGPAKHRPDPPATYAKPQTETRTHADAENYGRRASNAEVNAAAEQLWIDHRKQGTELTGAQLLELFQRQYPHDRRRSRWAAHRCKAARARFASTETHTRADRPDERAPAHLDNAQPQNLNPSRHIDAATVPSTKA